MKLRANANYVNLSMLIGLGIKRKENHKHVINKSFKLKKYKSVITRQYSNDKT